METLQTLSEQMTPEQRSSYLSIVNRQEKYAALNEEQKIELIRRIMSSPFVNILSDWAFKHVFGHNKKALMMLLNDFLPLKIVDISYESNEIDRFAATQKDATMDVICTLSDGQLVIVEMQTEFKADLYDRMFYYGAANITAPVLRGGSYSAMCPVYVLCFCNFMLKHTVCPQEKMVFTYEFLESETHEPYGDHPYLFYCFCELPRLAKEDTLQMDPVEEWFHIFRNITTFAPDQQGVPARFKPILEAARMSKMTETDKQKYLEGMLSEYDKQQYTEGGFRRGFDEGLEKGEVKGKEEQSIATAKLMLADKKPMEEIVKYSGLTEEQVRAL